MGMLAMKAVGIGVFAIGALGVSACGGTTGESGGDHSPVIAGETGGKSGADETATSTGGKNTSNGGATSTGGTTTTGPTTNAACQKGFDQKNPGDKVCNSTYKGLCFESDDEACACAGCGDQCSVADSYPSQVACPEAPRCVGGQDVPVSSTDPCNFVVNGACFAASEAACACAGCAEDKCMILESYPAQIRCAD
jgi:hypothetical protein